MSLYRRCTCAPGTDCDHPWWYKFKYRGMTIRESSEHANRRKAELVEVRRHAEVVDRGTGISHPKAPLLSTHIREYLEKWAAADHPASADKDARTLAGFLDVVGDKRISELSAFDVDRWRSARAKVITRYGRPLARSTINRDLNSVLGCLSKAVDWKRVAVSPLAGVRPYPVDDVPVVTLTPEERAILLQQAPPDVALWCRVTLEALPRLSEVINLTRDDLKPTGIQRRLKGGRVKIARCSPTLLADLRAQLRRPDQVYVFPEPEGPRAGLPPTRVAASVRIGRAIQALGLRAGISHHTMRHTGVTDMLDDGVNPRVIQELAGWSSLRMLQRYGHPSDAEAVRAVAGTAARNTAARAVVLPSPLMSAQKSQKFAGQNRKMGAQKGAQSGKGRG